LPADTVGARLSQQYGSAGEATGGLGHYRALYTAGDQVVFEVVPGARLTGAAAPNATVTVETTVEVGGQPVTYTRTATVDASGAYAVTVPYPGTYAVDGTTVDVSEAAVTDGATVTVNS
jgi:dolichyl-diphosphooligosaccharide--protein glycosyltransferase